jgi:hypothetical protein
MKLQSVQYVLRRSLTYVLELAGSGRGSPAPFTSLT